MRTRDYENGGWGENWTCSTDGRTRVMVNTGGRRMRGVISSGWVAAERVGTLIFRGSAAS